MSVYSTVASLKQDAAHDRSALNYQLSQKIAGTFYYDLLAGSLAYFKLTHIDDRPAIRGTVTPAIITMNYETSNTYPRLVFASSRTFNAINASLSEPR